MIGLLAQLAERSPSKGEVRGFKPRRGLCLLFCEPQMLTPFLSHLRSVLFVGTITVGPLLAVLIFNLWTSFYCFIYIMSVLILYSV